jgi:hypothetical protein
MVQSPTDVHRPVLQEQASNHRSLACSFRAAEFERPTLGSGPRPSFQQQVEALPEAQLTGEEDGAIPSGCGQHAVR